MSKETAIEMEYSEERITAAVQCLGSKGVFEARVKSFLKKDDFFFFDDPRDVENAKVRFRNSYFSNSSLSISEECNKDCRMSPPDLFGKYKNLDKALDDRYKRWFDVTDDFMNVVRQAFLSLTRDYKQEVYGQTLDNTIRELIGK